ncbi:MAG TPA: CBS domain-containing protein [Candidatus Xenobia bacterium]
MKLDTRHQGTAIPMVRDVMQTRLICVREHMSVEEVAHLLTAHSISGAPVLDRNDNVVGVVSVADLAAQSSHPQSVVTHRRQRYYHDPEAELPEGFMVEDYSPSRLVKDVMTPIVHRVHEDDPITDAAELMLQARIHRVLVTNGKTIVGIVTTMDLIGLIPALLGPN